jgi:hypothetical protein
MYVARLMEGYTVKRMPNTGSQHATSCPSYEPPAEFSGLGQLVGTAIVENPATGETALKLDFPMTKLPGRSTLPAAASASSSVASQGPKLGLRALLHYLWDQAELTHWKPGFAGRRTWGTVRKHLLQAAENKFTHGHALLASLYIPEVFSVEQREAITTRPAQTWATTALDAAGGRGERNRALPVWAQSHPQTHPRSGLCAGRASVPPAGPVFRARTLGLGHRR